MEKLDLTVVILTYNEERHISRCIENVRPIAKRIVLVDCFSKDRTKEIATGLGAEVIEHTWPGNQAAQFNWGVDNIEINTEWVLRLDADEYLLSELKQELCQRLALLDKSITGIEFKRRHIFMGRWVKHGIYPVIILRMFRNGCARYDNRLMDEHMILTNGQSVVFENDFCDHSLIDISDYCRKHLNYAQREAVEVLDDEFALTHKSVNEKGHGAQALDKHKKKGKYNKMPLFWRSFAYFLYRYIFKGGFLDGKEGFMFTFIQGWWYRTLIDAKIYEAKKACGDDKEKLKKYIKENWKIEL